MAALSVRPFSSDDLDGVVDVFRSNIPKYFGPGEEQGLRDFLAEYAQDYYVLLLDDEIVSAGGIALNPDETVSLCWGMVRSDHIGTGLGRKLTEFRIQRAHEKFGGLPLVIDTSQHTEGFYNRFGFVTTERTLDGYGPGLDICKMRRDAFGPMNEAL